MSTDTAEDEAGPDEPLPKDEESCRGEETSTDIRPPLAPSVLGDSDLDNSDDSSDAAGDGAFVGRVSASEEEHEL